MKLLAPPKNGLMPSKKDGLGSDATGEKKPVGTDGIMAGVGDRIPRNEPKSKPSTMSMISPPLPSPEEVTTPGLINPPGLAFSVAASLAAGETAPEWEKSPEERPVRRWTTDIKFDTSAWMTFGETA